MPAPVKPSRVREMINRAYRSFRVPIIAGTPAVAPRPSPRTAFVTHGELPAAHALANRIEQAGTTAHVPGRRHL